MGSAAVSFVSLFLSLTTGLHPVEVTVTGPVAAVEIRIDGETVAVMPRAPWKTKCDLGQLRPLVLEAVALDADGRECARAHQLVNLPRQAVESSLVLERSEDGLPTSARLISASAMGLERVTVQLTLDGLPLEVEDPDHFDLPPCDLDEIHFLSARVDYAQGVISHAELSFSGRWAGEMSTDLTAVPVLRPHGVKHLDVGELEKRFTVSNGVATVVAVEEPPASLIVVADQTAEKALQSLQNRRLRIGTMTDAPMGLSPKGKQRHIMKTMRDLRPRHPKLHQLSTIPKTRGLRLGSVDLFPLTPPVVLSRDSVMFLLSYPVSPTIRGAAQHVADAVAVAGLHLAASSSPRAVLLVLGSELDDASLDEPEQVRHYLEAINVPLVVWRTTADDIVREWGESVEVTEVSAADKAMKQLLLHLKRQSIVWLDGAHLPNEIGLNPGATELEIAR